MKQKVEWTKAKSREQLELEKRAENMWVNPENDKEIENTVKKLRDYDKFLERLKWLKDTETWNSVMEEIYNLFQNIRAKRLKPKMKSRWPCRYGTLSKAWYLIYCYMNSGGLNLERLILLCLKKI